jgi:C4-dicarboxylate transporter DctQ subunit
MEKIEKWLTKLEELLMTLFLIIMVILVFAQVICRYALHLSIPWTEELARYLMIVGTFFGAALAVQRRIHIQIQIRHLFHLKPRTDIILDLIVDLLGILALFLVAKLLYMALPDSSDRSSGMGLPMIFPMGAVVIGMILMIFHHGIWLCKHLKMLMK